ncbi:MAG: YpmS family protein [Lachnospiraceae bacterium]
MPTEKSRAVKEPRRRIKWIQNPWKIAFFALVGLILGVIIFLSIRVFDTRQEIDMTQIEAAMESGDPIFEVQLTKLQTNQIINHFLKKISTPDGIQFEFMLENRALLKGTFDFLGHEIQFDLYFEPYVLENGDIELRARSLSVGTLSIQTSELMDYVKKNAPLPSWVEVDTAEETIILHLNQLELSQGIYVEAEKIDLLNDDIRFKFFLPSA